MRVENNQPLAVQNVTKKKHNRFNVGIVHETFILDLSNMLLIKS